MFSRSVGSLLILVIDRCNESSDLRLAIDSTSLFSDEILLRRLFDVEITLRSVSTDVFVPRYEQRSSPARSLNAILTICFDEATVAIWTGVALLNE